MALVLWGLAGCSSDDSSGNGSDGGTNIPSTKFEKVTITTKGGTHEFAAGFKVVVPAGAVEKDTEIEMRLVGGDELRPIYEEHGVALDVLLAAVEGKPDGLTFKVPITVTMKADVPSGVSPVVYAMDLTTKKRSRVLTTVMADPDKDLVELTMHHFSPPNAAERQREDEFAKKECAKEPCKCKRVEQTTDNEDVLCGGKGASCEVLDYKLTVKYPDCGTVHKERQRKVSAGCEPKLILEAAASKICPDKDTELKATVNLGCPSARLEGQTVSFSAVAPAKVSPASSVTNADGEAKTTLTAGPTEGTVQASAKAKIEYYGLFKHISFEGKEYTQHKDPRTANPSDSTTVEAKPSRWKGTLTYHAESTNGVCIKDSADYDGSFSIEVDCDTSSVTGTATVKQSASPKASSGGGCDIWLENINAPASLNLIADGEADGHLHVDLVLDLQYSPFYTYDICQTGGCQSNAAGTGLLSIGYRPEDKNAVPLQAGTHKGSWSFNDGETYSGSYTITMQEAK
jgi:hypothetical protein